MRNKTFILIFAVLVIALALALWQKGHKPITNQPSINTNTKKGEPTSMKLTSLSFAENGIIPAKYTCDGQNINPALEIASVPAGARSLALLMDDPDVPKNLKPDGVFDHWTVFNMPPDTSALAENTPAPGITGKNGAGQNKYTGPCPPDREHRYFFKLFALDTKLNLNSSATKQDVLNAMSGHILAQTELMGRYNRPQNQK